MYVGIGYPHPVAGTASSARSQKLLGHGDGAAAQVHAGAWDEPAPKTEKQSRGRTNNSSALLLFKSFQHPKESNIDRKDRAWGLIATKKMGLEFFHSTSLASDWFVIRI